MQWHVGFLWFSMFFICCITYVTYMDLLIWFYLSCQMLCNDKMKICWHLLLLIRSFIEESRAGIKISSQDNNYYGLNDRLVTVTGTPDEQMQAIDLILSKLSEDAHYPQSMNVPFKYAGMVWFTVRKFLLFSWLSICINDELSFGKLWMFDHIYNVLTRLLLKYVY